MGGRGSKSMTAQSGLPPIDARGDKEFFQSLRDGFKRMVDLQEGAADNSVRAKQNIAMGNAAQGLAGTERGFDLVNAAAFKSLRRTIERSESQLGFGAMSALENRLASGTGNRPMWMELDEWVEEKKSVQSDFSELSKKGYTVSEVAAALRWNNYLRRRK